MARKNKRKTKTPRLKTPKRTPTRKSLRALKVLSYEENDVSTSTFVENASEVVDAGVAVAVTQPNNVPNNGNPTEPNFEIVNIRIDKFVLNKKQNV